MSPITRLTGVLAAAATAGTLLFAAPVAAAPATPTAAPATTAVAVPSGERNTKVSRSLTGVRSSAYVGRYYSARSESTRKCIVRRESGGSYRIQSRSGKYQGAYQFNSALANATARKMGRGDLVGRSMRNWSRFEQDKAFWVVWNHGRGRGHWPTARGC